MVRRFNLGRSGLSLLLQGEIDQRKHNHRTNDHDGGGQQDREERHYVQCMVVSYCRQVRAILARNHIRYSILDATSPRVQAIMVRRFGDTAVPRTVIGGVVVEGVDETRIVQLCRG